MTRNLALAFAASLLTLGPPSQRAAHAAAARAGPGAQSPKSTSLRFEVTIAPGLSAGPQSGRLLIMINRRDDPEPREWVGEAGPGAPPLLGRDVAGLAAGEKTVVDQSAAIFPIERLADLSPGDYFVQAVLVTNPDLRLLDAPGNLYSAAQKTHLDPAQGGAVHIELSDREPAEQLPSDTDYVRFVRIRSDLLSRFHGRPVFLRAAVILPRDFDREPERRYPLRVHIGGYGARFTAARRMMREGSGFRSAWLADDAPRMLLLHLDGAGPYGDPYQVNSANNGPYGDAVTKELIPYVEEKFRALGRPEARFLDGHSTGGWVSLALQVFYPEFFNGAWSFSPDPVDFHAFQVVDIYRDRSAYTSDLEAERPAARDPDGDVRFSMRHECQMENVMGMGDSWTMSGGQWGAWNAAFGPRGADGRPVPLWDPKSGAIDRVVARQWEKYDLRAVLERDWQAIGPKLQGKIHIWVGEGDDYFLNNAVHLLDAFLSHAGPAYGGSINYGPGKGHHWEALGERELMAQMAAALEKPRQRP
jgi:S-formylglutathione hydrolase FrmB